MPIVLGQCEQLTNSLNPYGIFIIDGQHRLAVITELLNFSPQNFTNIMIPIRIYKANDITDLKDHYRKINQNFEPHLMYDLNGEYKTLIDEFLRWLQSTYDKKFFKTSETTIRPFVSLKQMTTRLSTSPGLKRILNESNHNIDQCLKDMIDQCLKINQYYQQKKYTCFMNKQTENEARICESAYNKCLISSKPFYLGLKSDYIWIEDLFIKKNKLTVKIKHDYLLL